MGDSANPILLTDGNDEDSDNEQTLGRSQNNQPVLISKRARVSWGPQAPFDDVITLKALKECLSGLEFVGQIEYLKKKRLAIEHQKIAAVGVKNNGVPSFQISWDAKDCEPAFEELQELVQKHAESGQQFKLRLEIQWMEDDMEDQEEEHDGVTIMKVESEPQGFPGRGSVVSQD